jgi:4-hydroxy-3-polyprenylbenzoate decarboxylase
VLEGYIIEGQRVWETDEAEALGRQGEAPLHPEWARYMGRAYRTPRAFELTAITHRADKPYFFVPILGSIWYQCSYVCASIYEMCERMAPGVVQDVAIWTGLTNWGVVVVQVKKQRRSDEGLQRNIMGAIMTTHRGLRLCIVVDEDIDIWEPEDVVWAMESRVTPGRDIVVYNEFARGQAFQPSELKTGQISVSDGGIGLDATVPMDQKDCYQRAVYPTANLDLSKWFTDAECDDLRSRQDPYFRYLAKTGYA